MDRKRLHQIEFAGIAFTDAFELDQRIVGLFTIVETAVALQLLGVVEDAVGVHACA